MIIVLIRALLTVSGMAFVVEYTVRRLRLCRCTEFVQSRHTDATTVAATEQLKDPGSALYTSPASM